MTLYLLQAPLPLLYPSIYLVYRQKLKQKRDEVNAVFGVNPETSRLYQQAFGLRPDLMFKRSFNLMSYAVPIAINTTLVWALSIGILIRAHLMSDAGTGLLKFLETPRGTATVAAVSGAFVWGMYDSLRRYEDASLTPESLHFTWLRMLIAGALGPLVAFLLSDNASALVAFGIGTFPTTTLQDFVQSQAAKKLDITTKSDPAEAPTLQFLQGTTAATIEALKGCGCDSVEHLALADPLRLLMRTSLQWKVILDLIDQALLAAYLGDKVALLRPLGLRGAIEVATVQDQLRDPDTAVQGVGTAAVKMLVTALAQSEEAVRNLTITLDEDAQVQFIASLWGDAFGSGDDTGTKG